MSLLQTLREKLSPKRPCYECGQKVARLHRVQYNFHGTISHHEICDDCYKKLKGKSPEQAKAG